MSSRSMDDQVRKIFVGGLDYNTVETTLEQYFGQWGPVSECTIKRFPDGNSRGFGFVTFSSLAAMENCFESQPHMIDGKNVDLRKATENLSKAGPDIRSKVYDPESRELKKLFVGSLDFSTTEDEIKEYFLHLVRSLPLQFPSTLTLDDQEDSHLLLSNLLLLLTKFNKQDHT